MTLRRVVPILDALVVAKFARVCSGVARLATIVRCLAAVLSPCGASFVRGVRAICSGRRRVLVLAAVRETSNDIVWVAAATLDEGSQVRTLELEIARAEIRRSKVLTFCRVGMIRFKIRV